MGTYIQPQVQVFQEFTQLPVNVVANQNAFVFGPNYQLFRYSQPTEKALIALGAYNAEAAQTYAYPNQPAASAVDLSYVKLTMEDVLAQYAVIGAGATTPLVVVSNTERTPEMRRASSFKRDPCIGSLLCSGRQVSGTGQRIPSDMEGQSGDPPVPVIHSRVACPVQAAYRRAPGMAARGRRRLSITRPGRSRLTQ